MRIRTAGPSFASLVALSAAVTTGPACNDPGKKARDTAPTATRDTKPPSHESSVPQAEPAAPRADPALPTEDLDTLAVAEPGKAYGQIMIKALTKDNHFANLTVVRAEGVKPHSGQIPYTAEPRVVMAPGPLKVDESNLLGSGIAFDVNGDGDTSGTFSTRCASGTTVLSTTPSVRVEAVTSFTDDVARFDYGLKAARVLNTAKSGMLAYAPCGEDNMVVLGLDPAHPLTVHTVPSPAVFVVYRAEVESLDAEDPFSLAGVDAGDIAVDHELYPFREINIVDGATKIYAAHLVVFAIDAAPPLQHITVEIAGSKPEFVTASINEVDADGLRIRYADGFSKL